MLTRGGPIIWPLRKLFHPVFLQQRPRWTGGRGIPVLPVLPWIRQQLKPSVVHQLPIPATFYQIAGQTKDSTGAPLGECTVELFRTADDVRIETLISNADGYFHFKSPAQAATHYVVAYKTGSPDRSGTTLNTLTGV